MPVSFVYDNGHLDTSIPLRLCKPIVEISRLDTFDLKMQRRQSIAYHVRTVYSAVELLAAACNVAELAQNFREFAFTAGTLLSAIYDSGPLSKFRR